MGRTYVVQGTAFFRHHLVCSLLSGRAVSFENIRTEGQSVGLKEYEVSFLRLIDRVTNGTAIEIDETGTKVKVKPGVVTGGFAEHTCSLQRGVGYFLEPLAILAPFAKKPMDVTLTGITNNQEDIGVDTFRTVTLPLLKQFGVDASLRIKKRGIAPGGGGEVVFTSQTVRRLESVDLTERGKVKRVRGVAFCCRTSPDLVNRAISTAKGLLLKLLPDVFIASDHFTGEDSGKSPGYGLTLVAESTSDAALGLSEELTCDSSAMDKQVSAEEVGLAAAKLLLDQVKKGGCVDSHHQHTTLILMALSPDSITNARLGPLTPAGEAAQELCREFFSVTFSSKTDASYDFSPTAVYSCIGSNLTNVSKRSA
eukprot:Rhum_TRINITY_DN14303_c3_g2::Rhum_TRINITY_DN14303_c3_g2_i1::g.80009::m.80009/K11108/RCL1; RNA 3'-terminal phosphate cyclase-like protein